MALMPDDDARTYGLTYEEEPVAEEVAAAAAGPAAEAVVPVFQLTKVSSPLQLAHLAVANGIVVMAVKRTHVVRLDTRDPQGMMDVDITAMRRDDSIYKVFVDPTGSHILVTTRGEENYYLHKSSSKPKALSRMRGVVVESVAWCSQNREQTQTREVLVGTTQGRIFETSFEAPTEKSFVNLVGGGGKEQTWKLLYTLVGNKPVSGLRYERFTPTGSDPNRYFVMATTATQLYQFIGGPTFEQMMAYYEEKPSIYAESPPGATEASQLEFFCPYGGMPQKFAWLTGPGVLHGTLSFGSQFPGDSVAQDNAWVMYSDYPQLSSAPMALAMTEFHYLLLSANTLIAVNTLTEQVTFEFDIPPNAGPVRGLCKDPVNGVIRLFCDLAVYDLIVTSEDRDVWRQYMEKRDWDTAVRYCKNDEAKKDQVYTSQADYFFGEGKFELAAKSYAQTSVPFEEVCLKFINKDKRDPLRTYLLRKLDSIPKKMSTQLTVVCTWLVEIYLNKLNVLKETPGAEEMYAEMQSEFHAFLNQHKDNLNPATTFNLISSHGRIEDLLFYANATEDYSRVISHYIQAHSYHEAITALSKLDSIHEELFYKFSPMLMFELPEEMVKCWMRVPFLNPKRLFPALMRYDPAKNASPQSENQAIKYLQYCVKESKNTETAVHNLLLSLYAQQGDDKALTSFIEDEHSVYDEKYALRLCTKMGKWPACVLIYGRMGLFEEAVDLALKVDLDLAKSNANKPEDDGVKKRLWLKIAQHVVKENSNIKQAMQFLQDCELLKIEDILPFFPDFTRIDDFKDEICRSLEEYNRRIQDLKTEMDDATLSAEKTRKDIAALRSKYGVVRASQQCELCRFSVLTRQFYYFPCRHTFHADCLSREMNQHLTASERSRVTELQRTMAEASAADSAQAPAPSQKEGEVSLEVSKADALKGELDALIAAQCPLCSDLMIKQINQPFILDTEADIAARWALDRSV